MSATREEIEIRLLARVEMCRTRYEQARQSYRGLRAISHDVFSTPDGTMAGRHALEASGEFRSAVAIYQTALKELTDFVVHGKLPEWCRDEPG